jgi:catechol 2,3-dioxygenase-like lactoylglutathione lyase family enzyme
MTDFNFVLLYVDSAPRSEAFYAELLGCPAVESYPNFVMFAMASGIMLGLWARDEAQPPPNAPGGGEIALSVENDEAVDARHAEWRQRGYKIAQAPTDLVFGRTFVALDPMGTGCGCSRPLAHDRADNRRRPQPRVINP